MINVELLGKFFDNHSLSIINRYLALKLSKSKNINLCITPLDNINPDYNLSISTIKQLEKIALNDLDRVDSQKFPLSGNINLKLLLMHYVYLQNMKDKYL